MWPSGYQWLEQNHFLLSDRIRRESFRLIIYGEEDADFITEQNKALYAKMQAVGVVSKLVVIPDVGHLILG